MYRRALAGKQPGENPQEGPRMSSPLEATRRVADPTHPKGTEKKKKGGSVTPAVELPLQDAQA